MYSQSLARMEKFHCHISFNFTIAILKISRKMFSECYAACFTECFAKKILHFKYIQISSIFINLFIQLSESKTHPVCFQGNFK